MNIRYHKYRLYKYRAKVGAEWRPILLAENATHGSTNPVLTEGQNILCANNFETLEKACYKQVPKRHSTNQATSSSLSYSPLHISGCGRQYLSLNKITKYMPFSLCCLTVDTITRKNLVMEFHEILLHPNPNYLLVNFQIDNKWNVCDLQIAHSLDRVFQLLLPRIHTYTVEILFNMTLTWMMIHLRQQYVRMDKKWNMMGQLQNSSEFSFHFVSSSCWWG